jgi:glycosyltransferase involved in cell wall biosynthesis
VRRYAIEATTTLADRPTGISRYARCLIDALAALEPAAGDFELVLLYRSSRFGKRHRLPAGPRLRPQMWRNVIWPLRRPYDVVHVTNDRIPPWPRLPVVTTLYDIYASLGLNFASEAARQKHLDVYRLIAARSAEIIFISRNTEKDFLANFEYPRERCHAIHLGVGPEFRPQPPEQVDALRRRLGVDGPYLFFTGLLNPNKNLQRLLQAYAQSRARHDTVLVLAGPAGEPAEAAALEQRIRELGIADRVRRPGYVAEADIPLLYAGAAAFMFPSLYEGFGLPILEAMATGTPVLTSKVSSCPEVAAGHAELVDPASVEDIARGIDAVVQMSPQRREAARAYAQTKTWRQTALETLAVYDKAASGR